MAGGGCAIGNAGRLACWGEGWPFPSGTFVGVDGAKVGCAIHEDGAAECFLTNSIVPEPMPTIAGAVEQVAVAPGLYFFCMLDSEGVMTCTSDVADGALAQYRFSRIAAGHDFVCGILRDDGTLRCGGRAMACGAYPPDAGQLTPPEGQFIDVAAGMLTACAIRVDNELLCWGLGEVPEQNWAACEGDFPEMDGGGPYVGHTRPPPGKYKQVSLGIYHSCAVRTDGTVACWGVGEASDDCGPGRYDCGQSIPPEGVFDQVSVDTFHSCAMRSDRTITCWGGGMLILETPQDFP